MPSSLVSPAYKSEQTEDVVADLDPIGEVGREGGIEAEEEEEEEEDKIPNRVTRPYAPTKAELDEHLPLHLNYRDWCEECVHAKALAAQHRTQTDEHTQQQNTQPGMKGFRPSEVWGLLDAVDPAASQFYK